MKKPLGLKIFIGYLLTVFSISLALSAYGFFGRVPPYTQTGWAMLAIPKILALGAGLCLLKLWKAGAFLWGAAVLIGWGLVIEFGTTPLQLTASVTIEVWSIWVLWKSWPILTPTHAASLQSEALR